MTLTPTTSEVLHQVTSWSVAQQRKFLHNFLEQLYPPPGLRTTPEEWDNILEKRSEEWEAGTTIGITPEELFASLVQNYHDTA